MNVFIFTLNTDSFSNPIIQALIEKLNNSHEIQKIFFYSPNKLGLWQSSVPLSEITSLAKKGLLFF